MQRFLALIHYLYHPLIQPLYATLIYFYCAKGYFQDIEIGIYVVQVVLTTLILPLLTQLLIANIRYKNRKLKQSSTRFLYYILCALALLWAYLWIFNPSYPYALLVYFKALLYIYILVIAFLLSGQKINLGICFGSSLIAYTFYISLEFYQPLLMLFILFILLTSLLACKNLLEKKPSTYTILLAYFIGIIGYIL